MPTPDSPQPTTDPPPSNAAAPATPGLLSVSKGVDYYTFASGPPFSVRITAPAFDERFGPAYNFTPGNLQIGWSSLLDVTGTLTWTAARSGAAVRTGFEEINSITGGLEGGTLSVMLNTPSAVGPGYAVSYGFYAAGAGIGTPLTNQDQLYVYVSDNFSTWMGDLVAAHPEVAGCPFSQLALPGAHDAGMFTPQTVQSILQSAHAPAFVSALADVSPLLAGVAQSVAQRAITNLAMTQKDNVTTMLDLGTRYFDFRPGTLALQVAGFDPGVRYHQHALIPGYPYVSFLQDVLVWLHAHPTEIVVVNLNTQGFVSPAMAPAPGDLAGDLATALVNTGLSGAIATGGVESLDQTLEQLLRANTRLIFLNQIDGAPQARKYDSYSDAAYATNVPGPVLQAMAAMNRAGQAASDYTVLQMQAAATQMGAGVLVPAVLTAGTASSPLMSTKPGMDVATNPWLVANVAKNLSRSQLVVFLNDFVDNCIANTAITVTRQRMGLA